MDEPASAKGYRLDQNYPNPFAGTSQVEITLPKSSFVRLVIVDMKGELVQTVLDHQLSAGSYEVTLDATHFASGTYYYQMTAGDVTLTRQMQIMK